MMNPKTIMRATAIALTCGAAASGGAAADEPARDRFDVSTFQAAPVEGPAALGDPGGVTVGARFGAAFEDFSVRAIAGLRNEPQRPTNPFAAFSDAAAAGAAGYDPAASVGDVGFTARSEVGFGDWTMLGGYESAGGRSFLDAGDVSDRLSIGGAYVAGPWSLSLSYGVEEVAPAPGAAEFDRRRLSFGGAVEVSDSVSAGWALEWGDQTCPSGQPGECRGDNSFGGGFLLGIDF